MRSSSLFTAWQSGSLHNAQKADEYANDGETQADKWMWRDSSVEWYVSLGDVMQPIVQGDSGGGNVLSQRMTSTQQAVRQVVKELSPTLPLSPG